MEMIFTYVMTIKYRQPIFTLYWSQGTQLIFPEKRLNLIRESDPEPLTFQAGVNTRYQFRLKSFS